MTKTLCLGEMLIDWICEDNTSLVLGKRFLKKAGGAPANVAIAIAKLGGNSSVASAVGQDPFGRFLHQTLLDNKVNAEHLQQVNLPTTFAYVSIDEHAEREFVFMRGADKELDWTPNKQTNTKNPENQIYHFGAATAFLGGKLERSYLQTLEYAITTNAFISFDPNFRSNLWENNKESFITVCTPFLENASFIKLSEEEALLLTATGNLENAKQVLKEKYTATICITLGRNGTLLLHDKKEHTIPSITVKAIDTTGAGDAFVGGILWQLGKESYASLQSLSPEKWLKIVEIANKIAALSTTKYGALEALPSLSELKKLGYAE